MGVINTGSPWRRRSSGSIAPVMRSAMASCTANSSLSPRSKCSDQMVAPTDASTKCTVIRTRSFACRTEPSTRKSTPRSTAKTFGSTGPSRRAKLAPREVTRNQTGQHQSGEQQGTPKSRHGRMVGTRVAQVKTIDLSRLQREL